MQSMYNVHAKIQRETLLEDASAMIFVDFDFVT